MTKLYTHDEVYEKFDALEKLAPNFAKPTDAFANEEFMTIFGELRERILHCEPGFDSEHFRLFILMAMHFTLCKGKS